MGGRGGGMEVGELQGGIEYISKSSSHTHTHTHTHIQIREESRNSLRMPGLGLNEIS